MYQPIDPIDLLVFARDLARNTDSASIRTAGDRAYYAAYLFCRDALIEKDHFIATGNVDDHPNLVAAMKRVVGSFASYMEQMRQARNLLTYTTGQIHLGDRYAKNLDWMFRTADDLMKEVSKVPHR